MTIHCRASSYQRGKVLQTSYRRSPRSKTSSSTGRTSRSPTSLCRLRPLRGHSGRQRSGRGMPGTSSSRMSPRQDSCSTLWSAKSAPPGHCSSQLSVERKYFGDCLKILSGESPAAGLTVSLSVTSEVGVRPLSDAEQDRPDDHGCSAGLHCRAQRPSKPACAGISP